jgi:6-phosphogluconolactonase
MRLTVAADAAAAAQLAAAEMTRACAAAVAARGRAIVAVSGGTTPWLMLRRFAQADLSWASIYVAQVDERCVARSDARRNVTQLQQILVSHGPLPPANLLPMPADAADLDRAAEQYSAMLAELAGPATILDLVQLGLGSDGHTASLVPDDPALDVTDRTVTITAPYQDTRRMTLTYPVLSGARKRLWLVTGAAKAAALADLLQGRGNAPASRVAREHSMVIADTAAAHVPVDSSTG